ncbi:MAG TPA: MFS transporter [Pseudonocardiaceae bacterium]|jgi:MFS family permease|nr:MFS transporter [Pseudonocardiaceae bacterium]
MRGVFALPDFRLLFVGLSTSMVGDALMLLVYGIWVKQLTGSSGAAGLVALFVAVPYALGPLGGWVIDRFRRRPFLIVANLVSVVILLPLLAVHGAGDVWIVYLVACLYGISSVSIAGALNGLLQELLANDAIGAGNGVLQTVREGLRLGGPLAGAALFAAFGGATVAIIDAVTFLVAALAIARMTLRERPPEPSATPNWLREITVGLSYLRTEAGLRRMMAACAVAFLVIGINESLYYALVDKGLHRSPEFIGVLASAQGVGAVLGGLLSARLIRRLGELAATAIGLAACGIGAAVCVIPLLSTVLAGRAISGFGLAVTVVAFNTILQRRTPKALIGRVSMAAETITSGPQAISIAAGATLVSVLDYRWLLLIVLTGMMIGAAYLWAGRGLTARTEVLQLAEIPSSRS